MLRLSLLALASAALASKKALPAVAPPNTAAPRCWYSVADKNTYVQYMNAKHKSWHCQSTCSKPANGHTLVDSDCSCTCLNHAPHGACRAITHYHAGGQRVRNVAGGASCFEGCAAGMPLGLERSQDTRQCPVVGVQGGLTERPSTPLKKRYEYRSNSYPTYQRGQATNSRDMMRSPTR